MNGLGMDDDNGCGCDVELLETDKTWWTENENDKMHFLKKKMGCIYFAEFAVSWPWRRLSASSPVRFHANA